MNGAMQLTRILESGAEYFTGLCIINKSVDTRFYFISRTESSWELEGLNRKAGVPETYAPFDKEPGAKSLVLSALVNHNQWDALRRQIARYQHLRRHPRLV